MTSTQTISSELTRVCDIIVAASDLAADGQLINNQPLENMIGRI
jgi:hypothetical protein